MIRNLTDRILFAMGLLLFMQVPQFMDQYTQRLGGYLQGQEQQLSSYQEIADGEFAGDLGQLINEFSSSRKSSIREVGQNVVELSQQVDATSRDLEILEQGTFVSKFIHLAFNLNMYIASETLRVFVPGVPLTLEGIVCGLLGGMLLSLIFSLTLKIVTGSSGLKKISRPVVRRVEPKI